MKKTANILYKLLFSLIPVVVFFLSRNEYTSVFNFYITLGLIMISMAYASLHTYSFFSVKGLGILFMSTLLYLVASTGWFFSPFFFLLYLLSIGIAFIFGHLASMLFTFTLVILFSMNIGEVDVTYDFLVLLSLLTVLPLNIFLKRYFLSVKEQQKDILILKNGKSNISGSQVAELLSNKVNFLSANLREDLNDIKQLAYAAQKLTNKESQVENNKRIRICAEKALRLLNDFEQEVTGTTVKKNV